MDLAVMMEKLIRLGLDQQEASELLERLPNQLPDQTSREQAWADISKHLAARRYPFSIHLFIFEQLFPAWHEHPETAPAWVPTSLSNNDANLFKLMQQLRISSPQAFHAWSTNHYADFWQLMTNTLKIKFKKPYTQVCNLSSGLESPAWFDDAMMNITDSCFNAPADATAIIYPDHNHNLQRLTYAELNKLSNQIANSLVQLGYQPGDAIGIAMPMTPYAIAIYLGVIKMGGVIVSIADSFSAQEMAIRLKISNAKLVFTADLLNWNGRQLPLYTKVNEARTQSSANFRIIVLPCTNEISVSLSTPDLSWPTFLVPDTSFDSVPRQPMDACNILFSSGTTGEPKAIVWNHTTPIKAASDAHLHQNIKPGDVLAWPTNLGWMMGPWLVFAALINQAAIAVYPEVPKDQTFGKFIQDAKVTMLGVVPTLVSAWRQSGCMEKLDWSNIKVFSSTGECSNATDMLYLMSLSGYKPVIEYCGGTEVGGSYLTSTILDKNYPSHFNTPAMGLRLAILDEQNKLSDHGEVALIPPSIGLSTVLLNSDHHKVYYANMPTLPNIALLRRHGDQVKCINGHLYSVEGRVDDTMNLGGIKISAAEIERAVSGITDISEVAAVAITPAGNGPSLLVIYATANKPIDTAIIRKEMQKRINTTLNPLFKIHDLVIVTELPKTASNKIMRRVLRKQYIETAAQ